MEGLASSGGGGGESSSCRSVGGSSGGDDGLDGLDLLAGMASDDTDYRKVICSDNHVCIYIYIYFFVGWRQNATEHHASLECGL